MSAQRIEVDRMAAGRELDAMVADKVFGCRMVTNAVMQLDCGCSPDKVHGTLQRHLKEYSTDIAAAWEVVEKCGGKFIALRRRANNKGWTVVVHKDDISDLTEEASADTAPLAICRAALKVAEESV